jgi:hypothetical protein
VIAVHNPDTYMFDLRQVVALGRKRVGFLIGAGAPADLRVSQEGAVDEGGDPLIPTVALLTKRVLAALPDQYEAVVHAIQHRFANPNIEDILSTSRGLAQVLGGAVVEGLDGDGYISLSKNICERIAEVVDVELPRERTAFKDLSAWIDGVKRVHTIEIFTTNYDFLV